MGNTFEKLLVLIEKQKLTKVKQETPKEGNKVFVLFYFRIKNKTSCIRQLKAHIKLRILFTTVLWSWIKTTKVSYVLITALQKQIEQKKKIIHHPDGNFSLHPLA